MGFSSTATTELTGYAKQVDAYLEFKTNFDESSSWTTIPFKNFSVKFRDGLPAMLNASLINTDFGLSDETDKTNRGQLRALVRAICQVGSETKTVFEGRLDSNRASENQFEITAQDYRADFNETSCTVRLEPSTVQISTTGTGRLLAEFDPVNQPGVYGFVSSGPGDDAFDEATGTIRRPWQKRQVRILTVASPDNDPDHEITSTKFDVDWESGCVQMLIPDGDLLTNYYITDVTAYMESLATGAVNVDYARLFVQMMTYDRFDGGPGFTLGTHFGNTITAVNTGAKRFTIAGDFTADYKDNGQIYVASGPNAGTYTINGDSTLSGGNTLIVVDQTVPSGTAGGVLSPDIGLDLGKAFYYRGKCTELLTKFEEFQKNLKVWYYADTGRFRFRAVQQVSANRKTLIHPKSIPHNRDIEDCYTRIVRTGKAGLPINEVHVGGVDGTLTDITSGSVKWHRFTEQQAGATTTFAVAKQYLYDGDSNKGTVADELSAAPDVDDPGADAGENRRYLGWYYFAKLDLGAIKNIERMRIHMPGTRNEKASAGHQGRFHPGVRVEISDDDTNWFILSVDANGRYAPETVIDIEGQRFERPTGRYLRVLCAAYKQGKDNDSNPCIGLGEWEVFTSLGYECVREISPLYPVAAVDQATDYFEIAGDRTGVWTAGDTLTVVDSTGNDGNYTTDDVQLVGGNTRLFVTVNVPSAVADGELYSTTDYQYLNGDNVQRDYVDLWRRMGNRHRESREDFGTKYSKPVAADVALATLEESIRLFEQVGYTSICDPRIDQWDTALAQDEMNGDVEILVQDLTLNCGQNQNTIINGVGYGVGVLGT